MEAITSNRLMSEKEVAQVLNISIFCLRKWRRSRLHLPFVRVGRCVRYTTESVTRLVKEQAVGLCEVPRGSVAAVPQRRSIPGEHRDGELYGGTVR